MASTIPKTINKTRCWGKSTDGSEDDDDDVGDGGEDEDENQDEDENRM